MKKRRKVESFTSDKIGELRAPKSAAEFDSHRVCNARRRYWMANVFKKSVECYD